MNNLSKEEFKELIKPFKINKGLIANNIESDFVKHVVENKQRLDLILGINLLSNWVSNLSKNISYKIPEQLEFNFK